MERLDIESYRFARRLWLRTLRDARADYRAHRITFGEYYGKVKTAVALRHVAGLGYFPPVLS